MGANIKEAKTFEEAIEAIVEMSNSSVRCELGQIHDKDSSALVLRMSKAIKGIEERKKKLEKEIASRDSKEVNEVFIKNLRTHIEWMFGCISIKIASIKNSWKEIENIEGLILFTALLAAKAMQTFNIITFKSFDLNLTAERMISIYRKKNADYGNSFDQSLDEDGLLVAKIRIGDKVRRFLSLTKEGVEVQVKEESISDTLLDLANYCLMTIVYINNHINKKVKYEDEELNKWPIYRRCAAVKISTSPSTLGQLANDIDCVVRKGVAANPNTPVEALQQLAKDDEYIVRMEVARNQNTPKETLEQLAKDTSFPVRRVVAINPNIPSEILRELANDIDINVIKSVAANKNTPEEVLGHLANEIVDIDVIRIVASNPNTPAETLKKLATNNDIHVRMNVAVNPNTPLFIIEKLAKESDKYISKQIEKIKCLKKELLSINQN